MTARHHHATALVLDGRGVMIEGPSGTGKSSLALALIERGILLGSDAKLISDDQVLLSAEEGRLIAEAPAAIAGLIEIWPLGPRPISFVRRGAIDLIVELVPAGQLSRLEEMRSVIREGVAVEAVRLPARNSPAALPALVSLLGSPPFAR